MSSLNEWIFRVIHSSEGVKEKRKARRMPSFAALMQNMY